MPQQTQSPTPTPPLFAPGPLTFPDIQTELPPDFGEEIMGQPTPGPHPKDLGSIDPTADIGLDLDSPFQDTMIEPVYERPKPEQFVLPPSLMDQVDEGKYILKFLPKQKDVDKLLAEINRKVLRQTHLPGSLRDIQAAYVTSPAFRDIYVYLLKGRLPTDPKEVARVNQESKYFMVLDGLLFKINKDNQGNYNPLLCIPTSKVDILLQHYHSSPVAGHPGVTKCYMTINKRFHCPDLSKHVRAYIHGCHICQMFKVGKNYKRPFHKRINLNTPALTKISMDVKEMVNSTNGYKYILVILCEVSNFMVALPLRSDTAKEVCDSLMNGYVKYFGTPTHIICDKDPSFMSSMCGYFYQQLGIQLITVSPTNHKSLMAEHGIKSLANILIKHLSGKGDNWDIFLAPAMLAYNTYSTPNLDGYSPFELTLGRKAKIVPSMEVTPEVPVTGTFREQQNILKKQLAYLRENIQKFRDVRSDFLNRNREYHFFSVGQLVYMYLPTGALLKTGSKKIACHFVGPLVIYKAISPCQFLLMSLDGLVYPHLIEETRIKPGVVRTTQGNVTTLADLKAVIRSGFKIKLNKTKSHKKRAHKTFQTKKQRRNLKRDLMSKRLTLLNALACSKCC